MTNNSAQDLTMSGASGSVASSGAPAAALPPQPAPFAGLGEESDALRILLQASAAAESLQQRFAELNQRRAELLADQQQLEAERRAFEQRAQEFATEVARARTEQRELSADLEQRLTRVAQQEELLQRQSAELRSAQRALAEERVLLKQSVRSELDEERLKIGQERAVVEAERERLRQQGERDRADHADRLRLLDEELRSERLRLAERARQEIAQELVGVARQKEELQHAYEAQVSELKQQAEDLQLQREQFGQHVEAEQTRLREEVEKKRQALLTEQNNLQRRYRFQFEHLTRAKDDLEAELREFRREQQLFRSERLKFIELHRLRFRQLERVRTLLSEREESIDRETRIVDRSRNAALSDLQRQQRRSEEERDAILRDIESRQRRLRQQESSLAELAARLDERSQRLNRMRAELDQTQAEILEHRLVIEEARTGLIRDAVNPELARARLEQARNDVQSYFDRLRQQVHADRDKVESAAADLTERQQQFRKDRSELEQWFAEREAELNERTVDTVVSDQQNAIAELQSRLEQVQQRWQHDRIEAERTIRELLEQLTVRESSTIDQPPAREAA
ncbi:MAG: hypothetical protein U0996_13855 [Planctomycetaceae bacterium]